MSTTRSGMIRYKCFDGAHGSYLSEPCAGHTLEVLQHNTSDTVSIEIDGDMRFCGNDNDFHVLRVALEALTHQNAGRWQEAEKLCELETEKTFPKSAERAK